MDLKALTTRANQVLALGEATLATQQEYGGYRTVSNDMFAEFRAAGLSLLNAIFGSDHPYFTDFDFKVADTSDYEVEAGIGILRAARTELEGGWLQTTRGIVSAEIFSDFLEMAEHLRVEHYKDAAAVIAGSALEEHLVHLADRAGESTIVAKGAETFPKKADRLNSDLARANVYSKLDQKSITAWLDIRNKAAHGKFDEYDEAQVGLAIEGIRQFISRTAT